MPHTITQSPLALLTIVERQLTAALTADVERAGLSMEQWRVIDALSETRGRGMREVAEETWIPAPTLTKIVDRLVATNLVHRRGDPEDRRRVLVLLTRQGDALRRRLAEVVLAHERALEAVLGSADLKHLAHLLARLADR